MLNVNTLVDDIYISTKTISWRTSKSLHNLQIKETQMYIYTIAICFMLVIVRNHKLTPHSIHLWQNLNWNRFNKIKFIISLGSPKVYGINVNQDDNNKAYSLE